MKIRVVKGNLCKIKDEVIVIGVFEGKKSLSKQVLEIDSKMGGLIKKVIASGDFKGKFNQKKLLYTLKGINSKRILLAGLGKEKELTLDKLRGVIAGCAQSIRGTGIKSFAVPVSFAEMMKKDTKDRVCAIAEGAVLGLYKFDQYKSKNKDNNNEIKQITLIADSEKELKEVKQEVKKAETVCEAVYLARDLVSSPGNTATPTYLANRAKAVSKKSRLSCRIIDEKGAKKLKMGAFLSVAQGSDQPARFIILEHKPRRTKASKTVVIVGKAITFDSGGISLKPPNNMQEMKTDMSGGAAAIAVMQACSNLDVPVHVVGLIPAAENMPSGKALKPGDVVKSMSGKTIEIISTDAEGRLILADALTYSKRFKPDAIIDMATLTGACIIALGNDVSAIMGNNNKIIDRINVASEKTGEKVWQLPLWEEYGELIKSDIADLKNVGGRAAGTITAGYFLKEFVGDIPWAHIDIAGTAWSNKDKPYVPKGASGVCVRMLVNMLENWK
jgi:leucyl aminopeptidase